MARRIWTTPWGVNFMRIRDFARKCLSDKGFFPFLTYPNVKVTVMGHKFFAGCNAKDLQFGMNWRWPENAPMRRKP